jgi:hypothetical protein
MMIFRDGVYCENFNFFWDNEKFYFMSIKVEIFNS